MPTASFTAASVDTPPLDNAQSGAALVWFRRDLRAYDHAALYHALKAFRTVYCAFVFDRTILDALPDQADRRVEFIHGSVAALQQQLETMGGALIVQHDVAETAIPQLARTLGVTTVFANRDYEPAAKTRDATVAAALHTDGIGFISPKDQVIFDRDEVLTQTGKPFAVFTPYKQAWLKRLNQRGDDFYTRAYPVGRYQQHLAIPAQATGISTDLPSLESLGFAPTNLAELGIQPGSSGAAASWQAFLPRLSRYKATRDYPALKGVSYLSLHLRFGTLSIRELVAHAAREANEGAQTWLSELIWRDFYQMILDHHPHVTHAPWRADCQAIVWDQWPQGFERWCQGQSGYPLVDAAMRQLLHSGYMHNRLRMLVASFLTKDLGISWQAGEVWFARHLNDFDLSANNGGWQWAASTGCDAQPWFRIFNPVTQSEKFDPQGRFIRRYVPELATVPEKWLHAPWLMSPDEQQRCGVIIGRDYPAPLVDHALARQKTLARFGILKKE